MTHAMNGHTKSPVSLLQAPRINADGLLRIRAT